ncbi:CLUMA_CG005725, isoform A [Clunio marinus]|uniref:type I protein arginine methyltransferase n=1 Tax=Clunio marinus TaxID=568069 RepID=A0A1J1I011_9DIPT|nr:CLUMA_CG005725, isoform A [Clunio marinus]
MSDAEDIPKLIDENCETDSSDEDQWEEEIDESVEITKCLFSDKTFPNLNDAIEHLKNIYNFDLSEMKRKYSMDIYSYIKMINFIRKNKLEAPSELFSPQGDPLWLSDEYLKPVLDFESWLSFDFEELSENPKEVNENDDRTLNTIEDLKNKLSIKDQLIAQLLEDQIKMKEAFQHLISKESIKIQTTEDRELSERKKRVENGVASLSLSDDNGYFESYSHYGIHHSMLSDKVRTESYRNAILKNSSVIKDKIVMDLGCGTAILSMFASQAGAKAVYAVDQSDIIYKAMEIAQTNNFNNIRFVKGRLEDVKFPADKVDIIVSEWMGYLLLFEGMLDSVIYARKNYLKDDGLLLPNRCTISLVGYGSETTYNNYIKFFDNVYGFNMKCMIKEILREGHVEKCDGEYVLTKSNTICDLDLMTCDMNYSNFTYDFNLEVTKASLMTSFVGYFDTFFDLPEKVSFSTSPDSKPTHWKQAIFYLAEPVNVKVGDQISGKFICRRDRNDLRSLNIEIKAFGKSFIYDMN